MKLKVITALLVALLSVSMAQVNIGWSGAVTGPTSDAGQFVIQGIEDYCAYANEEGLIAGEEINCITKDDQYNNDNTLRNFEAYLDEEIVGFIGYATGSTMQLKVNAVEEELPVLGASLHVGTIDPPDNAYNFIPVTTYSEQVLALLEWIAENHEGDDTAKIAMFIHPSAFGRAPLADAEAASELLGVEIVEAQEATEGLDYTAMLQRWDNAGVQYVIGQHVQSPIATILTTAEALGLKDKMTFMGAHYTGGTSLTNLAGDAAEGFLWATSFAMADQIPLQIEIGERFGRNEETISDVNYTTGLLHAAIYIEAARRAVEAGEEVTKESIYQALLSMNEGADGAFDPGFSVSPVSFSDTERIGADAMHLVQVQEGAWVPITEPYNSSTFPQVHPLN